MSIIYDTLNRLETDTPALVEDINQIEPSSQPPKPMSLSVKLLMAMIVLLFVGSSWMVWYWSDQADVSETQS